MKTYDDCFVASDAVDWLHQYLKKNPNFGADVSRYNHFKVVIVLVSCITIRIWTLISEMILKIMNGL